MRGILPNASWVSDTEKAAAEQIIEYLRSPEVQKIATNLGLRPGVPGVELGAKFTPEFGVNPQAQYDSLRPPSPDVVAVMLRSWREFAKKPSQVVIIVDSSGSMKAGKLASVQNTLKNYIESLGPKEKIALIDFDSEIRSPVVVTGTPDGKAQGLEFVANLQVDGGTSLYDAILYGHNWLLTNFAEETINGIIVLTDGEDSDSHISLEELQKQLKTTDFSTDKRIALFTIGYGQENEFNAEILQQIAQNNGGYYLQGDPITILKLMNDLQLEF
jgi:Ca-activated chloride channel family protein